MKGDRLSQVRDRFSVRDYVYNGCGLGGGTEVANWFDRYRTACDECLKLGNNNF